MSGVASMAPSHPSQQRKTARPFDDDPDRRPHRAEPLAGDRAGPLGDGPIAVGRGEAGEVGRVGRSTGLVAAASGRLAPK